MTQSFNRIALIVGALILLTAAAPPAPGNLFGIAGLTITGVSSTTGVILFAGWMLKEWRETRKLSADDRLARREGYAKQVEGLQAENRNLRADLVSNEKMHSEYRHSCQQETDQLRDEVRGLEDQVAGLKRRIDAQSSAYARAISDGVDAPETMKRLMNKTGDAI